MTSQQTITHVKASTWIPRKEYEQIERMKGDISVSLWIRRAIRKELSEGRRATNLQTPEAAVEAVTATTTPQKEATPKEVEAV